MASRLLHNFPEIIPDAEMPHEVIAGENISELIHGGQNYFDIRVRRSEHEISAGIRQVAADDIVDEDAVTLSGPDIAIPLARDTFGYLSAFPLC
jgi:hypothetical protein